MKKRSRPSFLRQLERRYGPGRKALEDAARPAPAPRLPVVYPVPGRRRKRAGFTSQKGFIDMSVQQFVVLALFFVFLAAAASGAVAYGVVEATGGGPQGEQGLPGPPGAEGGQGPQGLPGDDAAQAMLKRLATMWAVQQLSALQGGAFVEFNNSQVSSCVQYVITGEPGASACPGFSAGPR